MDKKRKLHLVLVYGSILLVLIGVLIGLFVLLFRNNEASQQNGESQSTTVPNTTASETTEPPTTEPPTAEPPTTESPTTEPPATKPPATEPPATKPPATEPPATKPPATEPPATKPPATKPPATEPPATEPPATKPPATEPPATEPPTTEPPTTEPPTTEPPVTEPPVTEPPATEPPDAKTLLSQMTRWEKIGQLFMVRPEMLVLTQPGTTENKSGFKTVDALLKESLAEYPVGGFALFNRNLQSPSQIIKFNADLQAASKIPLFIAIDEEGGRIARIANHKSFSVKKYKSAAAVGATGNSANALEMGKTIGTYLKKYGFNMNFAPVADVYTNPQNTVIGDRAFSSDPQVVAKMAAAMAQGLRQKGITPVYKHFPGHGDTAEDSHYELAVSYKTLEEMMECEWLPFRNATKHDLVMLAHVAAPKITGDMTPATLSYKLVTECLRQKCGFSGLIITDSFAMDAIKNTYGEGEAAVMAFQAGCDIVLMPENVKGCFEAVDRALNSGKLTEKWLNNTVLRILEFKLQHGVGK